MSDLLERLGITDDPDQRRLAPRVTSASPQISSPQEFMHSKPKNFTVNIGYGVAEFNLVMVGNKCLTYIATFRKDGILSEVDKVEIYYDKNETTHITNRFGITIVDPVIIYSAAYFSESLRKAHIGSWSVDALVKYCGFRFF